MQANQVTTCGYPDNCGGMPAECVVEKSSAMHVYARVDEEMKHQ